MPENVEIQVPYLHAVTLRVRYSETDKMGIVYNANYLSWFEVARTEFCRRFGKAYRDWEALGYFLPVSEAYCKYKFPASYDDTVSVYCRAPIDKIKPHSILFEYRITLDSDVTIAEGWTKHAFVDREGKLYRRDNAFQMWLLEETKKLIEH
ncbi:acyl-CoA thioesterase [Synergistaceae bacterium OttesenSCG-928-I11]|nr:acyl-CoA thioesterase [Synergistaceae bacterium OttesenSCG-928-I11]